MPKEFLREPERDAQSPLKRGETGAAHPPNPAISEEELNHRMQYHNNLFIKYKKMLI